VPTRAAHRRLKCDEPRDHEALKRSPARRPPDPCLPPADPGRGQGLRQPRQPRRGAAAKVGARGERSPRVVLELEIGRGPAFLDHGPKTTRGYNACPRGCGGIGRRARFRSVWGRPRGGSSPLIRIAISSGFCPHSAPKRWVIRHLTTLRIRTGSAVSHWRRSTRLLPLDPSRLVPGIGCRPTRGG
jgi:hypothetical protein